MFSQLIKNDHTCPRHCQNHSFPASQLRVHVSCKQKNTLWNSSSTSLESLRRTRQVSSTCAVPRTSHRCHAGCLPRHSSIIVILLHSLSYASVKINTLPAFLTQRPGRHDPTHLSFSCAAFFGSPHK